jgi:hypothetical protein
MRFIISDSRWRCKRIRHWPSSLWIVEGEAFRDPIMGPGVTKLIDRYFAAMRDRDIESLMALFAADAVMVLPDGRELDGARTIRAMYEHLFATNPPSPAPMATIISSVGGAAEIETRLGDGSSRQTANFFHLNMAGLIRRLSVYGRG